jgi:hypothetical protein
LVLHIRSGAEFVTQTQNIPKLTRTLTIQCIKLLKYYFHSGSRPSSPFAIESER